MNKLSIAKILQSSTFVLSKVRFQPESENTRQILRIIGDFYTEKLELWQFKNFIQRFETHNPFEDFNVFEESVSVILKNIQSTNNIQQIEKYAAVISKVCKSGCELYDKLGYGQLSDLIDLLHGLPEALLFKEMWDPKTFWKTYFNPYRKKWDKQFMRLEQKCILRSKN